MQRIFRMDGKTTLALLVAALLLLLAAFTDTQSGRYERLLFEDGLWLPGKSCALPLGTMPAQTEAEGIMTLEGEAGYQNTIRIPQNATGDSPASASSAPAAAGTDAPTSVSVAIRSESERAALAERYSAAIALLRAGKLGDAERELTAFVVSYPDEAEGWRQLGDCRYNLGKVSEALGAYRVALRKDPENYLAERGRGVSSLYLGYDAWEKEKRKLAHDYFQTALSSLHGCLQTHADDELARYGQALAAEGASRQLYVIACKALGGEHTDQAKEVIRNCLDILDAAIGATEDRLERRPQDGEARMLLGCLLMRRAKILQPFGHMEEAVANLRQAVRAFEPLTGAESARTDSAKGQVAICQNLLKEWTH